MDKTKINKSTVKKKHAHFASSSQCSGAGEKHCYRNLISFLAFNLY